MGIKVKVPDSFVTVGAVIELTAIFYQRRMSHMSGHDSCSYNNILKVVTNDVKRRTAG